MNLVTLVTAEAPAAAAPLVAVDTVETVPDGPRLLIRARKHVDPDELYLRGHFPGFVIYPGVFLIETLIQAVAVGFGHVGLAPPRPHTLRSVRFLAPLLAGDELRLEASATLRAAGEPVSVSATVRRADGTLVATMTAFFDAEPAPRGPLTATAARPVESAVPDGPGLDHAWIRGLLPQRYPMLLLDRVLRMEPGVAITAVKAVTAGDACYRALPEGASADAYAYPVSLLVESFGQAAAVLWLSRHAELAIAGSLPLLAAVRDVRIEGDARPGDVIRHEVRVDHVVAGAAFGTGEIYVGDRRIATVGSLLAVVRPSGALVPAPTGSVLSASL